MSLTGHTAGGPAKVACITSGLFGTVSGSAVANVMTTGTFTIPMMQRIGYKAPFAGAVEAVASTGGQIMPPIMGAAAFVMAEFMGISYLSVAAFALVPAVLYFLAVFCAVHFEAKRTGMKGLPREELPRLGTVLLERGHLFLPLLIIISVLMAGYSAPFAALCGIVSVIPTALLRSSTRHYVKLDNLVDALVAGARNTVSVALACACAGIVIGVITLTGLGIEFTSLVLTASQNSLVLALVLTMLAGTLGSVLGTLMWYYVGLWFGEERLKRFAARHGRWLTLSPGDIDKAHQWFIRHGAMAVFFGRMIPAIRTLISVPAGLARMPIWKFLIYTVAGSALWTGILTFAGLALHENYARVADYVDPVSKLVVVTVVVVYLYRVITWKPH